MCMYVCLYHTCIYLLSPCKVPLTIWKSVESISSPSMIIFPTGNQNIHPHINQYIHKYRYIYTFACIYIYLQKTNAESVHYYSAPDQSILHLWDFDSSFPWTEDSIHTYVHTYIHINYIYTSVYVYKLTDTNIHTYTYHISIKLNIPIVKAKSFLGVNFS